MHQVAAWRQGSSISVGRTGKPGPAGAAARAGAQGVKVKALAAFQVVQLEQQRAVVCEVFQRGLGAHREDLLRHQAQFLHDGTVGAALDGAQGFGDGGQRIAFSVKE